MYALNLDQIATAIRNGGNKRTILVQGHMGTGKSSLLNTLAAELPTHTACYFDCTTKDLGDISIPKLAMLDGDGSDYVTYATNEELGAHHEGPIILMIDEYGKANPAVKNSMLRLMLERKIGSYALHPDSLVFATTNLGAEGVGDLLPPHARNRMTVVTSRKPNNIEWIEWGINNDIDHTLLGWAKDNPQLFASFEDIKDPEENPYIYHPRDQRAAFVTPRSMEAASDWLKQREAFDDQTLTSLLMGTIGARGAMDLMAFVKLADQLPSLESIKQDPHNAKVPDSAAAVCMVVYRALAALEKEWLDPWMDYMVRLDKEAQGMFANGVRAPKYSKQSMVFTNRKFTDWCVEMNYMFAADKK
jgi:energy-coupling factor transporter ATP-binding protein EcfA2|tara:strand:+ start:1731 stop:2810 length:1080 start_codon:yes stop_codon:yes gene_type:complete